MKDIKKFYHYLTGTVFSCILRKILFLSKLY